MNVEFDSGGHMKHIVNLDKGLMVSFTEQGFYWYASKYYLIINKIKGIESSRSYLIDVCSRLSW